MKIQKISPLKDKPLRNPGESLDRRLIDLFLDKIIFYMVLAFTFTFWLGNIWWIWYQQEIPNPVIGSIILVPIVMFCIFKVYRGLKETKQIKLGRDGEKAVGQFLERLRLDGAQVFHDIEGENFNLDHVVIHRSGVFVIETKTMSKSTNSKSVLFYNGKQILLGGQPLQSDAITQAKAASAWLHKMLFESTGKRLPVKGIVVFPGWYVKTTDLGRSADVAVLNPQVIPNYLANGRQQLRDDEVHISAYHLSRYIRTK